ncbi:hypothetical protein A0J52_01315 [Clostridium sporogenes]|uniref:Uncharacterized protein n=1 Tax=Clostridium sporogenes TaxID=1509 RepID=A0A6B4TY94_CLOSG|nr:hypothetical protein CLSPOx_05555 [Clostridium sporogenes]AVP59769.1 hypothetical protein C7M79_03230 [Clostridium botulinum]MBE6056783.1 hypothetical protein [Clostridium sp.]KOY64989.1 hypothetical protein AN649_14785 [Clostridium sporogenes]KYN77950.1 hypothetical protein A0J52_01315 [Clostridium sporogenes]
MIYEVYFFIFVPLKLNSYKEYFHMCKIAFKKITKDNII